MDRVSGSIKQVSNPLPKVLGRRGGGSGLDVERDGFERSQVAGPGAGPRGRGGACPSEALAAGRPEAAPRVALEEPGPSSAGREQWGRAGLWPAEKVSSRG